MFKMAVTINGIENVIFTTNEAIRNLPEKLLSILRTASLQNIRESKTGAPVDIGLLRASINYFVGVEGERYTSKIGSAVFYAPYVEYGYGRHKVGHRLFLKGGFKAGSEKLISLLQKLRPVGNEESYLHPEG